MTVGEAETELKQLKTKISHSEKELKEKSSLLLSKSEEATAFENELHNRTNEVDKVKKALGALLYKEGQMEELQKVRRFFLESKIMILFTEIQFANVPILRFQNNVSIVQLS